MKKKKKIEKKLKKVRENNIFLKIEKGEERHVKFCLKKMGGKSLKKLKKGRKKVGQKQKNVELFLFFLILRKTSLEKLKKFKKVKKN